MVGNVWVADSAEIYGIEFPKLVEAIGRHHHTRCQVRFAAPGKRVPVQLETEAHPGRIEHPNALWHYLVANAITGDYCDCEGFQKYYPTRWNSVVIGMT